MRVWGSGGQGEAVNRRNDTFQQQIDINRGVHQTGSCCLRCYTPTVYAQFASIARAIDVCSSGQAQASNEMVCSRHSAKTTVPLNKFLAMNEMKRGAAPGHARPDGSFHRQGVALISPVWSSKLSYGSMKVPNNGTASNTPSLASDGRGSQRLQGVTQSQKVAQGE